MTHSTVHRAQQKEFSERLISALRLAGQENVGATQIAAQFNERYPTQSISVDCVRKWLIGESIPTQGKLVSLAKWLKVSPGWLLYGGDATHHPCMGSRNQIHVEREMLQSDLKRINPHQKRLVKELVVILQSASHGAPGRNGPRRNRIRK